MNKHNKEVAEILQDLLADLENEDRSVGIYAIPWQQSRIIRSIIEKLENTPDPHFESFEYGDSCCDNMEFIGHTYCDCEL